MPPKVRQAERLLTNGATAEQFQIVGDFLITHWMPPFERSLVRLTALGTPATGSKEWSRFLADWRVWVTSQVANVVHWQQGTTTSGNFVGPELEASERADKRLHRSAIPAGASRCLKVITG